MYLQAPNGRALRRGSTLAGGTQTGSDTQVVLHAKWCLMIFESPVGGLRTFFFLLEVLRHLPGLRGRVRLVALAQARDRLLVVVEGGQQLPEEAPALAGLRFLLLLDGFLVRFILC